MHRPVDSKCNRLVPLQGDISRSRRNRVLVSCIVVHSDVLRFLKKEISRGKQKGALDGGS